MRKYFGQVQIISPFVATRRALAYPRTLMPTKFGYIIVDRPLQPMSDAEIEFGSVILPI